MFSFDGKVEEAIVDGELLIERGDHVSVNEEKVFERVEERKKKFV